MDRRRGLEATTPRVVRQARARKTDRSMRPSLELNSGNRSEKAALDFKARTSFSVLLFAKNHPPDLPASGAVKTVRVCSGGRSSSPRSSAPRRPGKRPTGMGGDTCEDRRGTGQTCGRKREKSNKCHGGSWVIESIYVIPFWKMCVCDCVWDLAMLCLDICGFCLNELYWYIDVYCVFGIWMCRSGVFDM